jgi:hypothetical protein
MERARLYIITLPLTSRLDKREAATIFILNSALAGLELETFWL